MKRLTILLPLLALMASGLVPLRAEEHPITVKYISWWNGDYPTVTWNGSIGVDSKSRDAAKYIQKLVGGDSTDLWFRPFSKGIIIGSVLTAVDGQDIKGWPLSRIYGLLDRKAYHTLSLDHPALGKYETTMDEDTFPAWMTAQGFHPAVATWNIGEVQKPSSRFKLRVDWNADWWKFKTYDWYVSSNDVLADKELLEKISKGFEKVGLTRDQENPDIVYTVVKDANQSIDYTYVPETIEHIQTGTTSKAVYGWKGKYLGSVTSNDYVTEKHGGYTQKTATTRAYMEVNLLETARLGEKVAPLIMQLKYNYNENSEADVDKLYEAAVTWMEHPIIDEREERTASTCTRWFYKAGSISLVNVGIILDGQAKVIGTDLSSSVVKKSGLLPGDVITDIDVERTRPMGKYGYTYSGTITVLRDGDEQVLSFSKCTPVNSYKPIEFFGGYTVK